jgi:hypothetical protein
MNEMPVVRESVAARILAHRRDEHPIGKRQISNRERISIDSSPESRGSSASVMAAGTARDSKVKQERWNEVLPDGYPL